MMYEEYEREQKIIERTKEELDMELMKSIIRTKKELENAHKNYEFAEGELIDSFLYEIKSKQSKLNYLINRAKANGLILDRIKEIEIRKFEDRKVV